MTDPSRPVGDLVAVARSFVRTFRRLQATAATGGRATLSKTTRLGPGARILSPNYFVTGEEVFIGADFRCEVDAEVGDDVLISSRVAFIGDDHEFDRSAGRITTGERNPVARVHLEGNNLIGFGSVVIGPARIGHGAVVGAGSLVTGDLEGDWIYVGRPARPLRRRGTAAM